jgi:hypothetical protein
MLLIEPEHTFFLSIDIHERMKDFILSRSSPVRHDSEKP